MSGVAGGSGPQVTALSGGRLHLHHGPIDLILAADGTPQARATAFDAAIARFQTVLDELVRDLAVLRSPTSAPANSAIAAAMVAATVPHLPAFITPMAAVAGAVADTILHTMTGAAHLTRAMVNNGGDIAVHLAKGAPYTVAIAAPNGAALGHITLRAGDSARGLATSGLGGRSQTRGIADAVTALATTAARADAAATLIANAVDLPGHRAIRRVAAHDLHPDSDLGHRLVVTSVGALTPSEIDHALARGIDAANAMHRQGLITAAALFLRGEARTLGPVPLTARFPQRRLHYA